MGFSFQKETEHLRFEKTRHCTVQHIIRFTINGKQKASDLRDVRHRLEHKKSINDLNQDSSKLHIDNIFFCIERSISRRL